MFNNNWNIIIAVLVFVLVISYFGNCYEGFAGTVDAKNAEALGMVSSVYNKDNMSVTNLTTTGTLNSENITVKNLTATNFNIIPKGTIVLWSHTMGAIPAGWVICDGNNQTPNLSDRFVLGSTSGFGVAGGTWEHNHDIGGLYAGIGLNWTGKKGNYISHLGRGSSKGGLYVPVASYTGDNTGEDNPGTAILGGLGNANHTPPYFRLAYIMKT